MQYPLINGFRHDWSSVNLSIDGSQRQLSLQSLSYSNPRSSTAVYGTSPQKIGDTRGTEECKCSIELLFSEYRAFIKKLGPGYKDKYFDVTVSFAERGEPTYTDEIIGCRLLDDPFDGAQGNDTFKVKLELTVMRIVKDGLESTDKPLLDER